MAFHFLFQRRLIMRTVVVFAAIGCLTEKSAFAAPAVNKASDRLIVHEWGTFTELQDASGHSVAGINVDDEPVPIRRLTPDHPVLLERIVTRLLAKAPDDRYQSAAALADDLRLLRDKAGAPVSPVRLMILGTGVAAIIGLAITLSC